MPHSRNLISFEALIEQLDRIISEAKPELQPAMIRRLESIRSVGNRKCYRSSPEVHGFDDNLYTIRETVLRYLPETLASYVSLPRAFPRLACAQGWPRPLGSY